MKYCVSARQNAAILASADEIMVEYRDREILMDLAVKYPHATLILQVPKTAVEIEWTKFKSVSKQTNLLIALEDIKMRSFCRANGLKYYWGYPITSYYELKGLKDLGVSYFLLGAPLSFDLDTVSKLNIPIRMVANLCYDGYIPRENGICGSYIRPEDVQYYEKYVDAIEFYSEDLKQEARLLRIYKDDKNWPGNLNLLLANFGFDVDNRAIPEEFAAARMQCRQNCMRNGACKFCYTAMKFSRTLDKNKEEWLKKQR